jgi:hypothetical protein
METPHRAWAADQKVGGVGHGAARAESAPRVTTLIFTVDLVGQQRTLTALDRHLVPHPVPVLAHRHLARQLPLGQPRQDLGQKPLLAQTVLDAHHVQKDARQRLLGTSTSTTAK